MRIRLSIASIFVVFHALGMSSAFGLYLIPYELRIGSLENPERYTALVGITDSHAHHFGEPDDLSLLLAQNYYANPEVLLNDYLQIPQEWYFQQILSEPRIYGPRRHELVEALRKKHNIKDGHSSFVLITEWNQLDKPLAMLRIVNSGPKGRVLLPTEADFLKESGERFPDPEMAFRWGKITDFQAESFRKRLVGFQLPLPERAHYWLEGENVELKNYAFDPAHRKKFFRHMYFILKTHKLFHFGGQTFPKDLACFPDGTPIPKVASQRWGRRVSKLWVSGFGRILERLYGGMGFSVWKKIQNESTFDLELAIMSATPAEFDAAIMSQVAAEPQPTDRHWLVYQPSLSELLQQSGCSQQLIQKFALRKKN